MNKPLSKVDKQKLLKLEQALEQLKSGEERYFPSTKLSSIKSLCQDETVRRRYCAYLYQCVSAHLNEKLINKVEGSGAKKEILTTTMSVNEFFANGRADQEAIARLNDLLQQLKRFQNKYRKVKWSTVRIVTDSDLLVLELLIECWLENGELAQKSAYQATRHFVERYHPSVGTGLIADSIPALESVLKFWCSFNNEGV